MKTKTKYISALVAAAIFTGCTSSSQLVGTRYPATSPGSVQLLFQEPKRPYEVIALVHSIHGVEAPVGELDTLRVEAAKYGADAVIVSGAHHMSIWEYAHADGKAIKFK